MKTEVQQLREQIGQELLAMRQGLNGFAAGTARHEFISAKMRRLDTHTQSLATHIGLPMAIEEIVQAYNDIMSHYD